MTTENVNKGMNNTVVPKGNDFEVLYNNSTCVSEFERNKPAITHRKIQRLEKDIETVVDHIEKLTLELQVLQSQFKSMKESFYKGE